MLTRKTLLHVMLGAIVLAFAFPCSLLLAEPSESIQKLMDTPATAFDVYLYQLYLRLNGPSWFGGPNLKEELKIYRLDYDPKTDVIYIGMHISPRHEKMEGFDRAGQQLKKNILLTAARDLANSIGVEGGLGGGAIRSVRIRNGVEPPNFNEEKIKQDIAKRVELAVSVGRNSTPSDPRFYEVRRTVDGQYLYRVEEPPAVK